MNPAYIALKMLRKFELVKLCKENKIRRYSKLRKMELVDLVFKTLHPNENKVLKEELKKPEIILKNEPILEIKPLEKVEIIVDIFEEKKEEKKEEKEPCPEKQSINFTFPTETAERDLRTIALFGNINEEKGADVCSSLYYLWMNTPDLIPEELLEEGEVQPETDIRMFISTFGGDAVEMFGIYDMMRVVKADDVAIRTIGTGKVMSAGVLLMAAGTKGKRRITKHCRVMLHQVSAGTFGTLNNMETELEEVKVIQDMYIQAIADNSNLSVKQIKKLFKTHSNVYLSAEEAVNYGLADTIV